MSDGVSTTYANTMLTSLTAASLYIKLHTGDPGAAGTANPSSVTTRENVTWGAPTSGITTASNQPAWSSWSGTNGEIVTDLSFWTASSGGTFATSMNLTSPVTMDTGNSITLTTISIRIPTAS